MGNHIHHHESHRAQTVILLLLVLPFFGFFEASAQPIGDGVIVSLSDYQSLLAFKREADPRGIRLRSWNGTRQGACSGSWAGLKCVKGQVVALQLPFKGLGGRITAQIGLLRGLRRISLHDNYLMGMVPSSIALLPNLRGLHLFNNRLSGSIPPSIGTAPNLQNVDLSGNFLAGSIPPGIGNASRLYRLNLSFNSLSGSIPDGVYQSSSLTFLSLDHNNLSGPISDTWGTKNSSSRLQVLSLNHNRLSGLIPTSMGDDLPSLILLDLSENNFTGEIPASLTSITNLTSFNVSHNSLSGQVPSELSKKFGSSAFVGNLQLCGYSSSSLCPASPPPENISPSSPVEAGHRHRKRKLSIKDIILILVGAILALLLLLCCVLLCCLIRKRASRRSQSGDRGTSQQKEVAAPGAVAVSGGSSGGGNDGGKLVLFDGPIVFTADDLLCATAEVMGKNAYGTVYKASMEDGNQVAVKRLREKLAKSPKEFEIEVAALGRIRHPNLLPLRAYYLGPKGEKLLVFDCVSKGSLSSFLHGHGPETSIDWPTRMKIALGITRSIHHLHVEESIAHGNLTASEVYLDEQNEPKISDYGVSRLMTDSANTNVIATAGSTGYRAPELQKTKKATTKSDIYSLGVIMLELLTGKPPGDQIDGADLPQWVASTVKEEWTNEVFDLELMRDASATGDEMLNTLKLALHLVDPSPEARPDVVQVLQQLEEINPTLAAVPVEETKKIQD